MKIKIPQSLRISSLVYNKRFTVAISIIIAFAMWLGITMTQNPIRTQTFTDVTASVSLEGTAAADMGLGIVSDVASQKFTVTVSGPNYAVSSLKSEDFILSASVVDINSAGTYTLDVIGNSNSSKTGYTFTSITPSTIDVTFDYIDSKEFTLVPKLIGVSASDGLVAETPVVSDSQQSTITVRGPRTTMEKIASVGTLAEVNKTLSTSQTFESDIVLYDSNDKIIYRFNSEGLVYDANDNLITNSFLTLSFTSVKVLQPISKTAIVSCKAAFSNLPEGMNAGDVSYSIDQSKVTVIGTPEVVDKLSEITLSPIDFRTVSVGSNVFEVSASLPDGVKLLESIDYFTVNIDVSNYTETVLDIKDIRCTGLKSDLKAKTDTRIRNVKICGPKDVIENLKASDLYAVVDLTDKSSGDHTVEAVIKSDIYKNIWQVGSYSTSVTLN
ncbi:MAG: hypothetical protein U0L33_07365 [Acutalibacteraceae bacterium]|nr:hypothetical protein [Acutalibacteraceae bacterium]